MCVCMCVRVKIYCLKYFNSVNYHVLSGVGGHIYMCVCVCVCVCVYVLSTPVGLSSLAREVNGCH